MVGGGGIRNGEDFHSAALWNLRFMAAVHGIALQFCRDATLSAH